VSSTKPDYEAVRRWVAGLPTAAQCARAEVEPFLEMTPEERLATWAQLQRSMNEFVRSHPPIEDPQNRDFWHHWRDPAYGRPR
jgi:hypothetical protein